MSFPPARAAALAAVAALVALAIAAAPAPAAVTATHITTPADPFTGAWDFTNGLGPYSMLVEGTTTGGAGSGELVDIRCDSQSSSATLATNIPVNDTTRAFSTYVYVDLLARPCVLHAVPSNTVTTVVSPFTGPRVYPSALQDRRVATVGPNSGIRHGFLDHVVAPDRTTNIAIDALGGCGLFDARPLDPGGDPSAPALDAFSCAGFVDDRADGVGATRSGLVVDDHNAFTGGVQFYSPYVNQAGMPEVEHAPKLDPATGALSVNEGSEVVRCTNDPAPYPPADPNACGGMTDAHVHYDRTTTTSDDNHVVAVRDRWSSSDGQPHSLDLLLEMDLASTAYAISVPWVSQGFDRFAGTASLPASPSAPGAIYVESDSSVPGGSVSAPSGAIVFSSAPDGVEFFDDGNAVSRYPQLHYLRTIPATGALEISHTYVFAPSMDAVRSTAASVLDAYGTPSVAIATPADRSRVGRRTITVTGTASDNGGVPTVAVNGRPAQVHPDGAWVARIVLAHRGANRIVAIARDTAGNAAQAAVGVTVGKIRSCIVPKVIGLKAHRAHLRILGRGCRLGSVARVRVRGYSLRKGRKRVYVRVRRGVVVAQRPKPGAKVARGTRVAVRVRR